MEIFIHRDGQDSGPYSVQEVQDRLASGRLRKTDFAWYEGAGDWMPLGDIPEVTAIRLDLALSPPARQSRFELQSEEQSSFQPLMWNTKGDSYSRNETLWHGRPSLWEVSGTIGLAILLSPVVVGFLILFSAYLRWRGTLYSVTAITAKIQKGMFVTSTRELRIADVRSIEVRRSGLAGFFAIGDVVLSSSARDDATLVFGGIPATEVVANLVRDLQDGRSTGPLRGKTANDSSFVILAVVALIFSISVWLGFYNFNSGPGVTTQNVTARNFVESAPTNGKQAAQVAAKATSSSSALKGPDSTLPSAAFLADVQQSQRTALAKYPQLGVRGSAFNSAFLSLLSAWKAAHDSRLNRSNWPEILAADCAAAGFPVIQWNTPRPPYPAQARMTHVEGSGSVRVTTDAGGRVTSAVIVQSTGSAVLDQNTVTFAESNWGGPANSTVVVPIDYRLQ